MQIDAPPGLAPMTSVVGFNGSDLLFDLMNKRPVELSVSKEMLNVRRGFVREILMRLPRQLSDVRLSQRTTRDVGQERLAIEAFDSDGLVVTLLADSVTCMPVALQYMGSGPTGAAIFRVELAEYRRYNGILIPTMLKTTKDGEPYSEEHDSEIQPNARLDDRYFRRAGS